MTTDFEIEINDAELLQTLNAVHDKLGDLSQPFAELGELIVSSINKNFEVGGRYSEPGSWKGGNRSWAPWAASTAKRRGGGKVLIQQGHMMGANNYQASSDQLEIGNPLIYAPIQNLGGKAGRGLKVDIPARPFFVIQEEDLVEGLNALNDHIFGVN